ncbi:ATP-binding protein [Phocaeicola massiliensis]|uniref:ATP-binding protein n=1 Tax=Phocaeicola massiliensis TaxID=204516 RepID=UPI0022E74740|nr:ATP-binding protein [Phocaeicola massiliensis]
MNNKHTATSRQFFQTLTICICLLFAGTYSAKASDRDHRQYDYVLILNSYNESAPWSNSITSPIMHKISELKDIDAYIEHLNLFMVNDSVMVDRFPQMLLNKYGKTPPKLLVLLGSMSMIFREEIKEMWGDVSILVCDSDPYIYTEEYYRKRDVTTPENKIHVDSLRDDYNITFMHTPAYLKESVKLMTRMIPNMKKLIFLGDGIYPNPEYNKQLKNIITRDFPYLQYQFISSYNYTLPELYNALRNADKETGVLVSTWFAETLTSQQMLINAYRSLSSISSPLFSIRYAGMDDGGMVGGYMYNEKIFINELLRNVSQILNGKPAREIPFFVPADAHPTFNYTTLVNKGLNPKLCPQDSIFYDKPENFLKKYIWVIAGIFITLLLIALIQQKRIQMLKELRRVQKQEFESQIKYTNLIDNMPILYMKEKVIRNESGNIVETILCDVNRFFETCFRKKENIIGKKGSELFPESMTEFTHFMETALREKRSITFPYYFKDVDTFYDIVLSPSLEEDTVDIFCLDSTELHNAQQMLSSTNHKLSLALEIANIIPWKWNLKEHSILCDINRPIIMTAMPGEIKEEQLSVSDEQYFSKIIKEDRPRVMQAFHDLIEGKINKVKEEYRVLNKGKNGRKIDWVEAQATIETRDEQNRPLTLVGSSLVITDRKRMEEELMSAKDRAEESNRLKSAFLANMSHEIRTPLNAIIGFSNILASTEEEQEKQEYINIIESNNTLLLQLISDILDLSKIEAGTLEFSYSNIDLNDMIKEVENITKCRMEGSGVQLIAETPLSSCFIRTEKNRLMQVINNFLTNAIKFTQKGSITFGYEIRDKMLYFHVTDTGCGIPANKKDSIFGRFVKLNSFAQGTGLGLSICRTIIEHMNGTIGVESEEGKGSTFWFTIPYQPARLSEKKAEEFQPITVQKDKLTILIAEDNESNYRLFQSILRKEYSLIHAWDGQEAIEKFKEHRPQIILMDINMPRMDGYEATKEIRKLSADVPIIAITAFAYASDEQRVLENGFDGYMSKPINAPLLKQQIASILQKRIIFL